MVRGEMRRIRALIGGVAAGLLALGGPEALAQASSPALGMTREQARTRILDLCVLSEAPKVGPQVAVAPKCDCYSKGVIRILDDQQLAQLLQKRTLPDQVRERAIGIFESCK